MWPPFEFSTKVVNVRREPYDVSVMRPSVFGNPFVLGRDGDRPTVIRKYREWFAQRVADDTFRKAVLALKGKRIGCVCSPAACHASVIAEYVEAPERFVP